MNAFFVVLGHYLIEITPALAIGFFLSGLIHEFIPNVWVEKLLKENAMVAVFVFPMKGA